VGVLYRLGEREILSIETKTEKETKNVGGFHVIENTIRVEILPPFATIHHLELDHEETITHNDFLGHLEHEGIFHALHYCVFHNLRNILILVNSKTAVGQTIWKWKVNNILRPLVERNQKLLEQARSRLNTEITLKFFTEE